VAAIASSPGQIPGAGDPIRDFNKNSNGKNILIIKYLLNKLTIYKTLEGRKMKKPAASKSRMILLLVFMCLTLNISSSAGRKAVHIGTSSSPLATAYNNARKIVRTSDDIRLVVYQDSVDHRPVIRWTWSADGFVWSQPEVLRGGEFPALAIDQNDRIYAAWTNTDSLLGHFATFQRESGSSRKLIVKSVFDFKSSILIKHVSLEATNDWLHIVNEYDSSISYYQLDKNTYMTNWGIQNDYYQIRPPGVRSRFPSITADLEYVPGSLHVLWTDSLDNPDSTRIGYWRVPEASAQDPNINIYMEYKDITYPDAWGGKSFPSISVRDWGFDNSYVMACSDMINNLLTVTSVSTNDEQPCAPSYYQSTVPVTGNPMPSADDTLPFKVSCAIVWQNAGEIYYGQAEDEWIITDPPVMVSEPNGSLKQFPSVCYKTFRADSFDVVWTEGNSAPYRVMYRRMAKCYMANPVRFQSTNIRNAVAGIRYILDFDITGGSGRPYELKILSGSFPAAIYFYKDEIWGEAAGAAGVYRFTIAATDFARSSSDTAEFTLVVKENRIEFYSPDSVAAETGAFFSYTARAADPWGRKAQCAFVNLPSWLTASDSVASGNVPVNSADTCFQVIASYRDNNYSRTDTMSVRIHPTDVDGIQARENPAEPPEAYALFPNYPNPFNPSTTIQFAVPEAGPVSIDLVDLTGNSVKTLVEGRLPAGFHSVVLIGSDIPSGVYLIRMAAGKYTAIRKCILLK
jgi:hypothetical protein